MQLKMLRSLLFVPGTSSHLLPKATQRGADAIILDLEDAIAPDRKQEARNNLVDAVRAIGDAMPVMVRVNADPDTLRADVNSLPVSQLAGIMLPKVESAEQVHELMALLESLGPAGAALPIAALIETPRGVLRIESIAMAHPNVRALGFGAEDYATEMSITPTPQSLTWPAHAVANCAHAFGQACWGLPGSVAEIDDMHGYSDLVDRARSIGFTGTVCIHPKQVPYANRGFGPTDEDLRWAGAVVAAAGEADAKGLGAVTLNGRMIDRPVVERARYWLSMVRT